MKKYQLFNISVHALLGLITVFFSSQTIPIQAKENKGFAMVELFTSEGCSSCPPADEAVAKLSKEAGDHVFVLGFHVDYWNYLGWKDEFSSAYFTSRQNMYAQHFKLNSIYTPQVIVNGKKEFVGSSESLLRITVRQQLEESPHSTIFLTAKSNGNRTVTVTCKSGKDNAFITNIALVQLLAVSHVKCGENEGRELRHINLVRDFKTITVSEGTVTLSIPDGLNIKDCFVVAYLQNKNSLEITGASKATIQ